MCWKCGKAIIAEHPVGRTLTCETCGQDIRSCKNCAFYSPQSFHECAESVEDPVRDKERANFCDLFRINPSFTVDHDLTSSKDTSSTRAFNSLFGD
ncbi:MAG: hypothetical protein JW875_07100 [Spirochaetales bacterium]|nr:hypothetical protein [Spirochaetales bacterium]HNQ98181.1 hypothetical protein [Treponemataceae bacterium]